MIAQQSERTMLFIPAYRHIRDTNLIVRLEGRGNYTLVHLMTKKNPLIVSRTLKFFELQLTDFIRVSKSSLINPIYVDKVIRVEAKRMLLELADGALIDVSRRRIVDTQARLNATQAQ